MEFLSFCTIRLFFFYNFKSRPLLVINGGLGHFKPLKQKLRPSFIYFDILRVESATCQTSLKLGYLGQFRHRPRQEWPAELLLRADGCWKRRRWEHGGHCVDPCDPRLHLLRVPEMINTDAHTRLITNSKTHTVQMLLLCDACSHPLMAGLQHQRDNYQRKQRCC